MHNFLVLFTFLEASRVFLINVFSILMMSAKLAALGLLKLKVFWNKGYSVIISVHDVTKKFFHEPHVTDVAMRVKFGNSSISMREVIIISTIIRIYKDLSKKINFYDSLGSSSIIWDWQWAWTWNLAPVWKMD